jgi:hypothetical protein
MLTKEQIDYLFDFCQMNGVVCYDVQVELVDHLANAIEKELADHPDWSFQKALDVVFVSFGYRKFAPLLLEKHKAARLYCWRLFRSMFLKQLRWPATWLAGAGFLYLFTFLTAHDKYMVNKLHIASGAIVVFAMAVGDMQVASLLERTHKKFMLVNMTRVKLLVPYGFMGIWIVSIVHQMIMNAKGQVYVNDRPYLLFMGVLIFAYALAGLAYFRTMLQLKARIKKDFPQIFTPAASR